jgi:hypothetical protein
MQQATRAEQSPVNTHGSSLPGVAPLNAFVINLCSSTSPVALTPPDHAGLKRFSFFVSRRREESRERFRLHMGYFDTQEEAEKLLDIVREIYPGAWAGLAPGQRLRAAAAQGLAAPTPAAAQPPTSAAAPAAPVVAQAVAVESAATLAVAATHATTHEPAAATAGDTVRVAIKDAARLEAAALALVPDEGRRLSEGQIINPEHDAAARSLNAVRAAIASLEDSSEPPPVLRPIPELKPAASVSTAVSSACAAGPPRHGADVISDGVALAVLESGAAMATSSAGRSPASAATAATTSTAAAGSTAAMAVPAAVRAGARAWTSAAEEQAPPRPERPYYAVQLMWSVQPMDIAQVPQLAIFSAYTLYGAEGNRDGRRWYGLRLGFFTDAVSAKQVAHYVRSEFATVSVVPVTARECERAKLASGRPSVTAPAPAKATAPATPPKNEFAFIEDKELALPKVAKPGNGNPRPSRVAPGKRAKLRTQSAVNGRSRTKPMTLEETLEILGAGELKMDDGREPLINELGVAHVKTKPVKNKASRLGRLFERLSERMGS